MTTTPATCCPAPPTKHARKRVLALADEYHITVTDPTTGEVLSRHLIEPNKTY